MIDLFRSDGEVAVAIAVEPDFKSGPAFGLFIQVDAARWKTTVKCAKVSVP